MNGMLLLVGSIVYFLLAYFLYGRFVAKRFGVDPKRATPAHTQEDGIDYVPTAKNGPFRTFLEGLELGGELVTYYRQGEKGVKGEKVGR